MGGCVMSDALADLFKIECKEPVKPVEIISPSGESTLVIGDGDEETDYAFSRAKHYEISQAGSEAITIALKIARETENPRAIEVLSGLLKNLSDCNKSLLSLNKDKTDAKNAKIGKGGIQPSIGQAVQTQNIYVGSSKNLNRLLNEEALKDK